MEARPQDLVTISDDVQHAIDSIREHPEFRPPRRPWLPPCPRAPLSVQHHLRRVNRPTSLLLLSPTSGAPPDTGKDARDC